MGDRGAKPHMEVISGGYEKKQTFQPPKFLNDIAREKWLEIVDNVPENHFRRYELPLLEQYCMAYSIYRKIIGRIISYYDGENDDDGVNILILQRTVDKQASLMISLSAKLRIATSSRLSNRDTARQKPKIESDERQGLMFD